MLEVQMRSHTNKACMIQNQCYDKVLFHDDLLLHLNFLLNSTCAIFYLICPSNYPIK